TTFAKEGIYIFAIRDGRRRGIGILRLFPRGLLLEDLDVPENLPVSGIDANHPAGNAFVGRTSQKYSIAPDDRRGPGFSRNGSLPCDVFRCAPMRRRIRKIGDALRRRPSKGRPVLSRRDGAA